MLEVTQGIGPGQGDLSILGVGRERKELISGSHVGVDTRLLVCIRVPRGPICGALVPSRCPVSAHSLGELGQDPAPPQASVSLSVLYVRCTARRNDGPRAVAGEWLLIVSGFLLG